MQNLLAGVEQTVVASFDIGVHPFAYDGAGGVSVNTYVTEVHTLEVATLTQGVEPVLVAQPAVAVVRSESVLKPRLRPFKAEFLILEGVALYLPSLPGLGFEHIQEAFRARFARHLVFVRFEGRPWLAE